MRELAGSLDALAGDRVSAEHLEAALARRLAQLADDPEVPLFFGRIDLDGTDHEPAEVFHIGRRHVSDPEGDPLVVDWRAPVSTPFYRATRTEPMGSPSAAATASSGALSPASRTRRSPPRVPVPSPPRSSRPRSSVRTGPMRDIVATIQPEQDVIVRSGLDRTVVVQGAPGTGKTAVGLHRAAYLLYSHRERVSRAGMIVVGPNASFLRYIRDVLPALGEVDATQTTVEEIVTAHGRLRGTESAEVARLKGDGRLAEVLRRAVWSHLVEPSEALVLPRGARRWRVAAHEARECVAQVVGREPRFDAGRDHLRHALAHRILVQIEESGEALDERAWDALARTRPVGTTPPRCGRRSRRRRCCTGSSSTRVPRRERRRRPHRRRAGAAAPGPTFPDAGHGRWTLADLVLLDEVADLLARGASVAHVVVDEAQDLSPMMLRALGRRARTGSLTVLGDLAQATTPWASPRGPTR